jgi:hypothetical protein
MDTIPVHLIIFVDMELHPEFYEKGADPIVEELSTIQEPGYLIEAVDHAFECGDRPVVSIVHRGEWKTRLEELEAQVRKLETELALQKQFNDNQAFVLRQYKKKVNAEDEEAPVGHWHETAHGKEWTGHYESPDGPEKLA